MSEFKEGDIAWHLTLSSTRKTKILVKIRRVYPSSVTGADYLIEPCLDSGNPWYTTRQKLKSLTPEEKLEMATFGKILEVD